MLPLSMEIYLRYYIGQLIRQDLMGLLLVNDFVKGFDIGVKILDAVVEKSPQDFSQYRKGIEMMLVPTVYDITNVKSIQTDAESMLMYTSVPGFRSEHVHNMLNQKKASEKKKTEQSKKLKELDVILEDPAVMLPMIKSEK
jgi:hypothetical protein